MEGPMMSQYRYWFSVILSIAVATEIIGGSPLLAAEPGGGQVVKPTFGRGTVTIGGVQFSGLAGEKDRNMATADRLIRRAVAQGAQIVMTPEVALGGGIGGERERAIAEPIPGPTTAHFSRLAKELGAYLLLGMTELRDGQIYNAMPVLSPRGELLGVMRKVHINRLEVPFGWRNGSEFPVWEFTTATGRLRGGIMICYDREMPESARILMLEGADVVFCPLACGCPTIDIHRCLLRTRAFENELYVVMVNQAAPRQNGHSMALDPGGNIVRELNEKEGVLIYKVDLDALGKFRTGNIYGFHHRRPEVYKILSDPAGQSHPKAANLPPQ
jgi:predicted amidohydrolase